LAAGNLIQVAHAKDIKRKLSVGVPRLQSELRLLGHDEAESTLTTAFSPYQKLLDTYLLDEDDAINSGLGKNA
jgi:hypothetical protein